MIPMMRVLSRDVERSISISSNTRINNIKIRTNITTTNKKKAHGQHPSKMLVAQVVAEEMEEEIYPPVRRSGITARDMMRGTGLTGFHIRRRNRGMRVLHFC